MPLVAAMPHDVASHMQAGPAPRIPAWCCCTAAHRTSGRSSTSSATSPGDGASRS